MDSHTRPNPEQLLPGTRRGGRITPRPAVDFFALACAPRARLGFHLITEELHYDPFYLASLV
jgi:hypothetical protein